MCLWGYLCLFMGSDSAGVILNGNDSLLPSLPWHRGFSRVLVTLPTCLEQLLHHSTDPNPRRRTACPQISLRCPPGLWQGCESGNLHFFPVESQQFPFALEGTRIQVSRKLSSVCLCLVVFSYR